MLVWHVVCVMMWCEVWKVGVLEEELWRGGMKRGEKDEVKRHSHTKAKIHSTNNDKLIELVRTHWL